MRRGGQLRAVSTKTGARNRRYAKERASFLERHPLCEVCGVSYATEVHHRAGRAASVFFREDFWLAVDHECHQWITDHPDAAIAQGYSVRRNQQSEAS